MIKIRPSPTADTRACDWSKVDRATLLNSSLQHIGDVHSGMEFFASMLRESAARHDHDKVTAIDHFLADFQTGFAQTGWWDNHRKVNRHHLTEEDGIPADVNLIDVLDFITDCVMAGMARSGSVRPLEIDPAVLQRAFENTAKLLAANVSLDAEPRPTEEPAPAPRGSTAWRCGCGAWNHSPCRKCGAGPDARYASRAELDALSNNEEIHLSPICESLPQHTTCWDDANGEARYSSRASESEKE